MYLFILFLEFTISEILATSCRRRPPARSRPGGRSCIRIYATIGFNRRL